MAERTGGCLCGRVRYRITAEPVVCRVCWCRDCQHIASNGTVNAIFPTPAIEITGELGEYLCSAASGNQVRRRFCARCGSHLFADSTGRPQRTVVRLGTLDDPSSIQPSANIWSASAPDWACLDAGLERIEHQPAPPQPLQDSTPSSAITTDATGAPAAQSSRRNGKKPREPLMDGASLTLRLASPTDAVSIAALAVQVFLDTYANEGIRPDLAREAFAAYSCEAFTQRLAETGRTFVLAETGDGLLGFAELHLAPTVAPSGELSGAELVRLYVQPASHGRGIGRALLARAEEMAIDAGMSATWLTAWDGNRKALGFYTRLGYTDVGCTTYALQGKTYANRVLARHHGTA